MFFSWVECYANEKYNKYLLRKIFLKKILRGQRLIDFRELDHIRFAFFTQRDAGNIHDKIIRDDISFLFQNEFNIGDGMVGGNIFVVIKSAHTPYEAQL